MNCGTCSDGLPAQASGRPLLHVTTFDHFKVAILPSEARKRDRTEALAKTASDGKLLCGKGFLTQSAAPNLVC